MTSFVVEFTSPLGIVRTNARRRPDPQPRPALSIPMNVTATVMGSSTRIGGQAGRAYMPASPPGVIGAAVIRAARHSAGLPRRRLAQMLSVSHGTACAWEDGTTPLFCVPYGQLRALADALTGAGALVGRELDELLIASQCDLLVTGMLHGFEDYAEVPPIDEDSDRGITARSLLRWALSGVVPADFRLYAASTPLLAKPDVLTVSSIAAHLAEGTHGPCLKGFGAALAALVQQ